MKPLIPFDTFAAIDLRVGKVTQCESVKKSEKLLRLTVDFGEEGTRNILSGIAAWYTPEELVDKLFIFVMNLEPRKMMGEESQGMLLAANGEKPTPLIPQVDVAPGASIR